MSGDLLDAFRMLPMLWRFMLGEKASAPQRPQQIDRDNRNYELPAIAGLGRGSPLPQWREE